MVIEASVFHEIVEEEVADCRHGVAPESDEVAVLDVAQRPELILELVHVLREVVVKLLDGDGVAVLQAAAVHLARPASADHVLLAQILRQPHHLVVRLRRHAQVEYHKTRRPCNPTIPTQFKQSQHSNSSVQNHPVQNEISLDVLLLQHVSFNTKSNQLL